MAVMMAKLYQALRAANVSDDAAREAAEEAASHENRFAKIEAEEIAPRSSDRCRAAYAPPRGPTAAPPRCTTAPPRADSSPTTATGRATYRDRAMDAAVHGIVVGCSGRRYSPGKKR
jgi:hypothetical protein